MDRRACLVYGFGLPEAGCGVCDGGRGNDESVDKVGTPPNTQINDKIR